MAKVRIEFETDNAALDAWHVRIAGMMHDAGIHVESRVVLRDSNGHTIGKVEVTE